MGIRVGDQSVQTELGHHREQQQQSGIPTTSSSSRDQHPRYAPVGELGSDGRWDAAPSEVADYTTRIVVLKPSDVTKFNGTVIVEWLNVSGGIDAPAIWFMAHRELIREGYAYVAVSAQQVGVEGGASLGMDMSLKKQDPERYSASEPPRRRLFVRHLFPDRAADP